MIGEHHTKREVLKSSLNNNAHTLKLHQKRNFRRDPFISLVRIDRLLSANVLYTEASATANIDLVKNNNGANVYIRYKG